MNVCEFLIFKGADVNQRRDDGWSPLYAASYRGHVSVVRLLAGCCADIEAPTCLQRTALLESSYKNDADVVQLLLELNADTTKTDRIGWTVRLSHSERIRQLLRQHSEKTVIDRSYIICVFVFFFFTLLQRMHRQICRIEAIDREQERFGLSLMVRKFTKRILRVVLL
jgi:ankyrin repeat protein